jgi:hypothetical protein
MKSVRTILTCRNALIVIVFLTGLTIRSYFLMKHLPLGTDSVERYIPLANNLLSDHMVFRLR